tara:strand:+ start:193 stop:633 length:441 start_codon:yes stop_codon:yes gene_type:complete
MKIKNTALDEYIKLVYGKDSSLAKIADINEKKQIAIEKTGAIVDYEDESLRKLILEFLREQNHYKHSLLMTKQEVYWEFLEVLREPLKHGDDDKRLKNVKLKGDINDLCSKLIPEIEALLDSIYGAEFKEMAQKTVVSFEQRLKAK